MQTIKNALIFLLLAYCMSLMYLLFIGLVFQVDLTGRIMTGMILFTICYLLKDKLLARQKKEGTAAYWAAFMQLYMKSFLIYALVALFL